MLTTRFFYNRFLKRLKYTRPSPATEEASHRATAKFPRLAVGT